MRFTIAFLLVLAACAVFGPDSAGGPAPMHDLVTGSDDPNNAQPMFMHRSAMADAGADAGGDR